MRIYPSEDVNSKKDKNYIKVFNKTINEAADQIVSRISERSESSMLVKQSLEKLFDLAMLQLIKKTKLRVSSWVYVSIIKSPYLTIMGK